MKTVSVKSSFSSHISRHHSKRHVEFLSESVLRENYKALTESNLAVDDQEFPNEEILQCTDDEKVDDTEEDVSVTDVFKENFALFYSKVGSQIVVT